MQSGSITVADAGLTIGFVPKPTPQTVDALMKLDLAAGVNVEIKLA